MRERFAVLLSVLVLCLHVRAECPAFTARPRFTTALQNPHDVIPADVNHDGKLDVAVMSNFAAGFQLGNGDGTFRVPGSAYTVNGYGIAAGDLNGDGHLDLATANYGDGSSTIVLGRGDGTGSTLTTPIAPGAFAAAIGELTSDGKPDLIFTLLGGGVVVYAGDGTGHFATNAIQAAPGLGGATAIVLHDFDGDGKLDFVAPFSDDQTLRTFFGRGDGTFRSGPVISGVIGARASVLADFDRDGILDLALGSPFEPKGEVFLGTGGGAFKHGPQFNACSVTWSMSAADLTSDGKLDLVLACQFDPGGVRVLVGGGDGTFAAPKIYRADLQILAVSTGDFDGDHKTDIVMADYENNTIGILANTGDCQGAPAKRRSARH